MCNAWHGTAALLAFATTRTLATLTAATFTNPFTVFMAGIAVSTITAILTITAAAMDLRRPAQTVPEPS